MFILATNAACYPSKKNGFPLKFKPGIAAFIHLHRWNSEISRPFFFHPRYCSFDRFDEEPSSGVARAERWSYRTVEPWNVAEFPKGGQQLVAWRYRTSDDHLVVLALLMIERFVHTDFASLTQFKTTRESSMFNYTPRNTNIAPPPNF